VDLLSANNARCRPEARIPIEIIERVAILYNEIQKSENVNSAVNGDAKKFVKRGNNKNEILAALTFHECSKANVVRKKGDIAEWMDLKRRGFSRGEGTLKTLKTGSKLKLQLDVEAKDSFVERYLNASGVMDARHRKFVSELVQRCVDEYIGTGSVVPTKVVGAIYILASRVELGLTADTIQDRCDNIKKNTFMRFVRSVEENIDLIENVFRENGVPLELIS